MWIIPKNLPIFHSAQAMEGLTLDLNELSEMSEQSLMWRSKPSQSATWLRRWKTDLLTQHLYGRILKPSLGNSLVEEWISSVEASLVNHSVPQEEEKEMKTQDTCGPISQKGFNSLESLPLFSWKTLKESSVQNSKEIIGQIQRTHLFCSMYSESWKDWITKQRRAYSQRVKLVHHTKEKEFLFLVSEMNSSKQALIMSPTLLTTPKDQEQLGLLLEEKNNIGMNHQESQWATPTTRDWKDAGLKKEVKPMKDGNRRMNLVPQQVLDQEAYRGKLNPRWIEILMGLPIGWTMPSCQNPVTIELTNLECWEMELCQIQPQEHLSTCGKNWATPNANDYKQISLSQAALNYRKKKGSQFMLSTQVHEISILKERLLQKHQGAKETALILPEVYDHCILGIKDGLFVYSSTCVLNTLYQENVDAIKNGILELYDNNTSIEESALDYALEMYTYNIEGAYEKDGPFFIDEDEEKGIDIKQKLAKP